MPIHLPPSAGGGTPTETITVGSGAGTLTLGGTSANVTATMALAGAFTLVAATFTSLAATVTSGSDFSLSVGSSNWSLSSSASITNLAIIATGGKTTLGASELPDCVNLTVQDVSVQQFNLVSNKPSLVTLQATPAPLASLTTVAFNTSSSFPLLSLVDLRGCALTQAVVDHIIAACLTGGQSNGTLYLNNGTSASPSSTGMAGIATLILAGWTVVTN